MDTNKAKRKVLDMKSAKLILNKPDGTKVWVNMLHAVKMEKLYDGKYFLFLLNGEVFEISQDAARTVERFLEDFDD